MDVFVAVNPKSNTTEGRFLTIKIFKSFSLYFFIRLQARVSPPVFVMDVFVVVNPNPKTNEKRFVIVH